MHDNALIHFGIPGMKWGFRKKSSPKKKKFPKHVLRRKLTDIAFNSTQLARLAVIKRRVGNTPLSAIK